jgi:hypothetical protein
LGLAATATRLPDHAVLVRVSSSRLAYGVRVSLEGYMPDDDAFTVEPGGVRTVRCQPGRDASATGRVAVTAANLLGSVSAPVEPGE